MSKWNFRLAFVVGALCALIGKLAWADGSTSAVIHSMMMIDEVQLHRWAFDRELQSSDQVRVTHHDPRQQHFNGWSLRSLDGKVPPIDEQWQFLQSYAPAKPEAEDVPLVENRLTRLIQPESLQLINQTEQAALFHFSPRLEGIEPDSQNDLSGKIWFDVKHQHITKVEVKSEAPLKTPSGVTFSYFNLTLSFVREQGFVLPQLVEMRFGGQVDGVNLFAQHSRQHYQNYQLIFPPPSLVQRLNDEQ